MEVTLALKYSPHVQRPATCWLVSVPDAELWIKTAIEGFDHSCNAGASQLAIRILPIPKSLQDRSPIGAVIVGGADARISRQRPLPECYPYGCVAERLYLPVEAKVEPQIAADELNSLLSHGMNYVWHPQAGLIAFEESDARSIADLISIRHPEDSYFDQALTGTQLPTRLTAIGPATPPSFEVLLESGRDGIGTQGDELSQLQPSDKEPKPGLGTNITVAGLTAFSAGLSAMSYLGSMFQGRNQGGAGQSSGADAAGDDSWLDKMQAWARQRLESYSAAFLAQREKEINRLMNLLAENPDEGLKYALPIGGEAHRGIAPPSNQLPSRNTDFNLSNLGGGRPADSWNLSWQRQQELLARYRELANREIHLGRHRRAAYIYAQLLSDFESAANTLKQGQHWREAAVLYKEKLNQPLEAANCFKEGGLWTEAIELYIELGEHEQAGHIHVLLEQREEAAACFQAAVDSHSKRHDHLAAARLLEEDLNDIEGAAAELEKAWPHTGQAPLSLSRLFELYGRHARHETATAKLKQLSRKPSSPRLEVTLIETLSENAILYPDREVKKLAADTARVTASRILTTNAVTDTDRVLRAVRRLVPEDRLLSRDCLRYGQARSPRLPGPRPSAQKRPMLVRTIQLHLFDNDCEVYAAATSGSLVFVGIKNKRDRNVVLYRLNWRGDQQSRISVSGDRGRSLILTTNPTHPDRVWLNVMGGARLTPHDMTFPAIESAPIETVVECQFSHLLGASMKGNGTSWIADLRGGSPILVSLSPRKTLLSTAPLSEFLPVIQSYLEHDQILPMLATGNHVYLGFGNELIVYDRAVRATSVKLEHQIIRIVGALPNTRRRTVISLAEGALIFWDSFSEEGLIRFAHGLPAPFITINRGGYLIAAAYQQCEIYSTREAKINLVATLNLSRNAAEVLAGNTPNQFGIVYDDGSIELYEVP
ncbi:hypothetical protein GC197_00225 [bacterium]|nr:hypothetical protein [bacterium]